MGHVMLSLGQCLDQELMDLMRSWVGTEEGRKERSVKQLFYAYKI